MREDFLTALKDVDNFTFTENGAVALKSTGNRVLDAFGSLGGMMHSSPEDILNCFYKAFAEDRALAMKLAFYMRDIRGGQGMRNLFRIIMRSLAFTNPEFVLNNLDNFLYYGRGDDLLCLLDTPIEDKVMKYIKDVIEEDFASVLTGGGCSLLGKWLPSENASSNESKRLARKLIKNWGISPKTYRKILVDLRKEINIVETLMSQNRWNEIEFDKLPSRASLLYKNAFCTHVRDNYISYLKAVADGQAKINGGALFPVDIIHKISSFMDFWGHYTIGTADEVLYDALWNALPNYFELAGIDETGICVVDTSGSMYGQPIEVAVSLGIYCADKCRGPFKNHFITFSSSPSLQEITGNTLVEKVRSLITADWRSSTNIEAVFDLILNTAIKYHTPQEDLPSKLYIISDMQFNIAHFPHDGTFMDAMKQKYADAGYVMPAIVYWNVRTSNCGMFQAKYGTEDCCMVSGYSPSIFKSVLLGTDYIEEVNEKGEKTVKQKIDPLIVMQRTLNNERYDRVWCGKVTSF